MTIVYYPGCTLKHKAKNLEDAALAAVSALGIEMEELTRWNCCGAVYSLADDDLVHQIAPVRDLIRAREMGADKVVTLCSMCYNTLARANRLMREDDEKRHTINTFMDEEPDYAGEVEVVHFLTLIRDEIGWDGLAEAVKVGLDGLKVAPYYGCTLTRPYEVSIDDQPERPSIMRDFLTALGAEVVPYADAQTCCGSYQMLTHAEAALASTSKVLGSARDAGAEVMAMSCPLCEYNLGVRQRDLLKADPEWAELPTLYFTQLLAIALGLGPEVCRTELNVLSARELLDSKNFLAATPAP
jgi:heterodisulfide reductase subunit B2